MSKVIFITGASRGFGKLWAEAFLRRGDRVVATARNLAQLDELVQLYGDRVLPLQLDVTIRDAGIAAIQVAQQHFGRIDVLINNAGYGLFGPIEEATEQEVREQLEVNVLGLVWMIQAILPVMRAQGSGHIINVSSVLGLVGVPTLGLYNASKYAVEGISEALAKEVKAFGINVTLVEPNAYATDWSGASAIHTTAMPQYDAVKASFRAALTEDFFGDPAATPTAVLQLVDASQPPLHFLLGKKAYAWVKGVYDQRWADWNAWRAVSEAAHGK
ncbi:oxidoreductase [Paraflavitalea pollutisoli]|uniref:oxidoreductase n=1 Tax=Paraflavitalea pollutisoli TaxID=3034143 RepID=UPI0023EC1AD4|nr:oxidoreductase [Paraflavitalea sp. H1-2-19X]